MDNRRLGSAGPGSTSRRVLRQVIASGAVAGSLRGELGVELHLKILWKKIARFNDDPCAGRFFEKHV